MNNMKIKVNTESESKEVQELFFELGYYWAYNNLGKKLLLSKKDVYLFAESDGTLGTGTHQDEVFFNNWFGKEITIQELRDMVNPMKEYLEKQADGSYKLMMRGVVKKDDDIEVPEGATYYAIDSNLGIKKNYFFRCPNDAIWVDSQWMSASFSVAGQTVLWQRHTHPEELPFIDDDFKLNIPEELKGRADLLSGRIIIDDEPLKVIDSEYSKDGNSVTHTVLLNDQYAEIETVRQTLKTRQDQYGSFEDVAMITEQMVDIMRKGYYENLAYNQKMALYMICSKMARIVNGNPNHKDSWHDIAGYATLIDNELVSEKDIPF